jgi:hypothetical protein
MLQTNFVMNTGQMGCGGEIENGGGQCGFGCSVWFVQMPL